MDAQEIRDGARRWQARYDGGAAARDLASPDPTTLSGDPLAAVYGPPDGSDLPGFERIGWPGEFPFTRGIHATGYRGKPWTFRRPPIPG